MPRAGGAAVLAQAVPGSPGPELCPLCLASSAQLCSVCCLGCAPACPGCAQLCRDLCLCPLPGTVISVPSITPALGIPSPAGNVWGLSDSAGSHSGCVIVAENKSRLCRALLGSPGCVGCWCFKLHDAQCLVQRVSLSVLPPPPAREDTGI